ncbi:MAG: uridine kinase [Bacteroidetes bacterium]|nr:uridine kinase [Bacteroidota bacterium]
MKEDVLFINKHHESTAQTIFEKVVEERTDKYIIAVSGESESGKSEISHVLGRLLRKKGIRSKIINMDSFYKIPPLERRAWRQKHGVKSIGYNEYDWKTIERVIRNFKAGSVSEMPYGDVISNQIDRLTTDFSEIELLIINGLYSIKVKEADLRIFIEVSYKQTTDLQIRKDMEEMDEWRLKVLQREHEVIKSIKDEANYYVDLDTSLNMYHL